MLPNENDTNQTASETPVLPTVALAEVVLTAAGPRNGVAGLPFRYIEWLNRVNLVDPEQASALAGFLIVLRRMWDPGGMADKLAAAAASNDLLQLGRLIGARDVNAIHFHLQHLPDELLRKPMKCSLLDVAIGSGAVEASKYLLEFHGARCTVETLKMAISSGNLELIRIVLTRLSGQRGNLVDLAEVAADFPREEPLTWLLRDMSESEIEAFACFALERHLADAIVTDKRLRPWSGRALELGAGWRAVNADSSFERGTPPSAFTSEGGWWTSTTSATSGLPGLGQPGATWVIPASVAREEVARIFLPAGVASLGQFAFSRCTNLGRLRVPSSVRTIDFGAFQQCSGLTEVLIPSSVATIGSSAFMDCTSLVCVTIPCSVKCIGDYAFARCAALECVFIRGLTTGDGGSPGADSTVRLGAAPGTVTIGEGAFRDNANLDVVSLGQGVALVGSYAFASSLALTAVVLPPGVTIIGTSAFFGCSRLARVSLSEGLLTIEASAFEGTMALREIRIPSGVTTIGESAFNGCTGLTRVTLPESVSAIGDRAFCSCSALLQITLPPSIASLGNSVFHRCTSLEEIEVPAGVETIGDNAFARCSGLVRVTLSNELLAIGNSAFGWCTALTQLAIPSGVERIGAYAFQRCIQLSELELPGKVKMIQMCLALGCLRLQRVILPSRGVTTIGESAFMLCGSITEIILPETLKVVGKTAFSKCSALPELIIPSNVETIGERAFDGCLHLTHLEIPSSVTSMGADLFARCPRLEKLTIPAAVKVELGDGGSGQPAPGTLKELVLVGPELGHGVVEAFVVLLAQNARVVGAELRGKKFDKFTIVAP